MKKTLAILLALLITSSIALVSCENNSRTPNSGDWDDENDYVDESDDGTSDTSDESGDSTDSGDEGNNSTSVTGWIEKNDTVYAGYNMNLYESTSTTSNKVYDGIKAGDAIARISTNETWDKVSVTVNGETKTGYVVSKWVSTTNNFSFTAIDPVKELEVIATDGNRLVIFKTPHMVMNGTDYDYHNIVCKGGLTAGSFSQGYTLKAVGENANWIKVEFVGTITLSSNTETGTTEAPLTLYIKKSHVKNRIDGFTSSSGENDNI